MMKKQNIGLIGLGVMGENLTLNMEDKGYSVAVYNRTSSKTEDFAHGLAKGKNILPAYSLEEFVNSLESPRKMILLVKQGKPINPIFCFFISLLSIFSRYHLVSWLRNKYIEELILIN